MVLNNGINTLKFEYHVGNFRMNELEVLLNLVNWKLLTFMLFLRN